MHKYNNDDIIEQSLKARAKADFYGIASLDNYERNLYEYYLLTHINKTNDKGIAIKPIHANIVDLVLLSEKLFVLNQDLYIYHVENGTYKADPDGIFIKSKIRGFLDREFIEDKTIKSIYNLILSDSRVKVNYHDINKRPKHWIHFKNGYYDYKTDSMRPHNADYYDVNCLPWEYDPKRYPANYKPKNKLYKEGDPLFFDQWITEAVPDPEDRIMLLQYIGYCMTLDTSAQKFMLICGAGGTGKSTLLKLVEEIIGSPNISNISLQSLQNSQFAAGSLYLKQINICADIPTSALTEIDKIKQITGEDTISVDRKYKAIVNFRPYVRLIYSTNELPYIAEKTNAIYRRMLILKMNYIPEQVDPDLYNKLRSEIPHIITRIVEELCCSYGEIDISENCKKAVHSARKDCDSIEAFISDMCEIGQTYRTEAAYLYRVYQMYCENEGRKSVTNRAFYKDLDKRNYPRRRGKTNYDITGLRISPEAVTN